MDPKISKMRHIFFLLWSVVTILLITLSACGPNPTPTPPSTFIGVNMRELAYLDLGGAEAYNFDIGVAPTDYLTDKDTRGAVQQQLETASHMGVTVIRVYLNNPNVNTTDVKQALNDLFAFTDYLKDQGRINQNIQYILVLNDFYRGTAFRDLDPEYFRNPNDDPNNADDDYIWWLNNEWFRTGYQNEFGSGYGSFEEYALDMINTYQPSASLPITVNIGTGNTWGMDTTLIYAWELGNEFQAGSLNDMVNFITDAGCMIHNAIANNNSFNNTDILFAPGFISAYHATSGGGPGTAQALYDIRCSDGERVFDFGTIHGYNNQWDSSARTVGGDKQSQLDDITWFNGNGIPYIVEELGFTGAYPGAHSGNDSDPNDPPVPCGDGTFPIDPSADDDRSVHTDAALDYFLDTQQAVGVMQWGFKAGQTSQAQALTDGCRGMDSNPHLDWDSMFRVYCNKAMSLNPSLNLTCDGPTSAVDVVVVMDTTGSMSSAITAAKSTAINYIDQLANSGIDYRAAVVEYKDKRADPFASRLDLPFSTDRTAITNAINVLSANGGGDTPEDVYSGLMTAINLPWRNGVKKAIVLIGDAGPNDPESVTGYTLNSVVNAANAVDPASIYAIRVGTNSAMLNAFQQLADGTGGITIDTDHNASNISEAILQALNLIAHAPSAVIGENNAPILGSIGVPVHFNASQSFDIDGTIVQYDWDFDNNGTFDFNSPAPTADHTYTESYDGFVTLQVTDNDGYTNAVSTRITIDTTDTTPPAITINAPTASDYLHPDSLTIDFIVTDDISGVETEEVLLDSAVVLNGQDIDLDTLALGTHTFTVNATDKAGNTSSESVEFNVIATIDSLMAAVEQFHQDGNIDQQGIYYSLIQKLKAAAKSNKPEITSNILNAFIYHVKVQRDRHITAQAADLLIADAKWVITHLEDTTPPYINIKTPFAITYLRTYFLRIEFDVFDSITGVKEINATLDDVAVTDHQRVDLHNLTLGEHVLTVNAVDYAGNESTKSVTFKVAVTIQSLKSSVVGLYMKGDIDSRSVYQDLLMKLKDAENSRKPARVIAALNSFIQKVQQQSGEHIIPEAADELITDAQWLLEHIK